MKKIYAIGLMAFIALAGFNTAHAQFGHDVKIDDLPTVQESAVSMDVAFNGWIYAVVIEDAGYVVKQSRDNGDTWTQIDHIAYTGSYFSFARLVVAGTDTNSLSVYVAGARQYSVHVDSCVLYVDRYDGRTGNFLAEPYFARYSTYPRGIALTTDYKAPSTSSSPYAVGFAYILSGGYDTLQIVTSVDAGVSFGAPVSVTASGKFLYNPTISYGQSPGWNAGRFFVAWNLYQNYGDKMGNLYCAYNVVGTSIVTSPFCVDSSATASTTGFTSKPKISCSTGIGNDSSSVTAAIAFERHYQGGVDIDIWLAYNMTAPSSNSWEFNTIDNTGDVTIQPDISFDPAYDNFLITYFDSSTNHIPYVVEGMNLAGATPIVISTNYADDTTALYDPYPTVRINPALTRVAVAWLQTPSLGEAMFDAEYRLPSPVITALSPDTVIAGNSAFTLGIQGKGFINTSVASWNGTPQSTTFVSSNLLNINVPAPAVATPGTADVTVNTPSTTGGGGTSNMVVFYIVNPLGINEPNATGTISIYPNPAGNNLNISYSVTGTEQVTINMYDLNGNLVKGLANTTLTGNGLLNADVTNLAAGVYEVVMQNGNTRSAQRISIAH